MAGGESETAEKLVEKYFTDTIIGLHSSIILLFESLCAIKYENVVNHIFCGS